MELYIQDLTLFTINRGHRDTGSHVTETITKKRVFLLGATPGHGEEFFLFVCGLNFLFSLPRRWFSAIMKPLRQHLPAVSVPFPKLLRNTWLSFLALIIYSSAQFHCYMPGFSVAYDQYRLNHSTEYLL